MRRRLIGLTLAIAAAVAIAIALARSRRSSAPATDATPWSPLAPVPDPEPAPGAGTAPPSVDPDGEGGCPDSHPIKGKLSSGIFHVPGGLSYGRTKADRCYASPEAAERDGLRASKN